DAYDLDGNHLTRSERFRLQLVTPEQLLALLERRELALRARLEQTIDETRNLRDTLALLRRGFESAQDTQLADPELTRQLQLRRLRAQQSGLQANKTSEELLGIATSLDDILREMVNNRVDSVDRRERIGTGVRDPLMEIVEEPLARLVDQILQIEKSVSEPEIAAEKAAIAVDSAEDVLLRLTAVLDKMLDLESYNEILDMVRELIDDQQNLLDDTIEERKNTVRDLFK
ncbi:MAG: polyketide synthase, partial [Pirellulales bacterium]|nr:polyketide synthase [Pirellulales bacterium]